MNIQQLCLAAITIMLSAACAQQKPAPGPQRATTNPYDPGGSGINATATNYSCTSERCDQVSAEVELDGDNIPDSEQSFVQGFRVRSQAKSQRTFMLWYISKSGDIELDAPQNPSKSVLAIDNISLTSESGGRIDFKIRDINYCMEKDRGSSEDCNDTGRSFNGDIDDSYILKRKARDTSSNGAAQFYAKCRQLLKAKGYIRSDDSCGKDSNSGLGNQIIGGVVGAIGGVIVGASQGKESTDPDKQVDPNNFGKAVGGAAQSVGEILGKSNESSSSNGCVLTRKMCEEELGENLEDYL